MTVEFIFAVIIGAAVLALAAHAWWTMPQPHVGLETIEVGHVAAAMPPPTRHDVLDDYEHELNFNALTAEGSAEHRLTLLEALLQEADNETSRLELLVSTLGQELALSA